MSPLIRWLFGRSASKQFWSWMSHTWHKRKTTGAKDRSVSSNSTFFSALSVIHWKLSSVIGQRTASTSLLVLHLFLFLIVFKMFTQDFHSLIFYKVWTLQNIREWKTIKKVQNKHRYFSQYFTIYAGEAFTIIRCETNKHHQSWIFCSKIDYASIAHTVKEVSVSTVSSSWKASNYSKHECQMVCVQDPVLNHKCCGKRWKHYFKKTSYVSSA